MNIEIKPRAYQQVARAETGAETHRRIFDAFLARVLGGWLDAITLDDVARDAGVSVQTVIRRFGGKDGLLQAVAERVQHEALSRRDVVQPGDWRGQVRSALADYEVTGDLVVRLLAQEERWPALKPILDNGRAGHRRMIVRIYRPWLQPLDREARERRIAALVVLTDVYAWRLLRRDQKLDAEATTGIMLDLVGRLVGEAP